MVLEDAGVFATGVLLEDICQALLNVNFSQIGEGGSMGSANAYPRKHWYVNVRPHLARPLLCTSLVACLDLFAPRTCLILHGSHPHLYCHS
jgi:hypothetical protein